MNASLRVSAVHAGLCLLSACGGTEEEPRGSGPTTPVLLQEDFGGRPADCSAENGYEFMWVEDFETGAATGWYTNTDTCDHCNDIDSDIAELKRPLGCLLGDGLEQELATRDPDLHARVQSSGIRVITGGGCTLEQTLAELYPDEDVDDLDQEELVELGIDTLVRLLDLRSDLLEDFVACPIEECIASQTPHLFDRPLLADEIINGPRCDSVYAMHIVAQLRDYGGTLGRNFSVSDPMDLQDWDGLAFWARVGPSSRNLVKVSVGDAFTDEGFVVDGEPVCLYDTFEDDTTEGCDKHGSWVSLTEDWEFYTLPFSEMRQAGWGKPAPFFDISRVLSLNFDYQGGTWDIWIDDVGFYRSAED